MKTLYTYCFFTCLLIVNSLTFGQKQATIWYFGNESGLDFNTTPPTVLLDGKIDTDEGSASICDNHGKLLFYTDGVTVWNKNHDTMLNGQDLKGSNSSCQSALIVPKPSSKNIYYLFTSGTGGSGDVCYSIIDMYKDNDRGIVTTKNILLFKGSTERLGATLHSNGRDVWIASTQRATNTLFLYLLTANGLELFNKFTMPLQRTDYGRGQLKFSIRGNYLVFTNDIGILIRFIQMFKFDNETGILSNPRAIFDVESIGLEFSPNEQYLYFSHREGLNRYLYQTPLDSIMNKSIKFTHKQMITNELIPGVFQLGPDGKIYITNVGQPEAYLSVINEPNNGADETNFNLRQIYIVGKQRRLSFPNFVSSLVYPPILEVQDGCLGDSLKFLVQNVSFDSIGWFLDDGTQLTGNLKGLKYQYSSAGTYNVKAIIYGGKYTDTLEKQVVVHAPAKNILGKDSILCIGETITYNLIDTTYNLVHWSDGTTTINKNITSSQQLSVNVADTYCISSDTVNLLFIECGVNARNFCLGDSTEIQLQANNLDSIKVKFATGETISTSTSSFKFRFTKVGVHPYNLSLYKFGLVKEISRLIEIYPKPKVDLGSDSVICDNYLLKAKVDSSVNKFLWQDGSTKKAIEVNHSDLYRVQVWDDYCTNSAEATYAFEKCSCNFFIPSALSPNGDGTNDVFKVVSDCTFQKFELKIYNRWGELLFVTNKANEFYQPNYDVFGSNNVLFYTIEATTKQLKNRYYKGTITLVH